MGTKVLRDTYKIDVAISVAGKNRGPAERYARALRRRGVKVFYDKYHKSALWGQGPSVFDRNYGRDARFVVPFISRDYVKSDWCLHEYDIAKEEARKRKRPVILPVRIDNTRLLGLRRDTCYLSLQEEGIKGIVEATVEKIKTDKGDGCNRAELGPDPLALRLLDPRIRIALGLIASSILPLNLRNYSRIFPAFKWKYIISSLRQHGLVHSTRNRLKVPKAIKARLIKNSEDANQFNKLWQGALDPIRDCPDIAMLLAMYKIEAKDFKGAVTTLANSALAIEPGTWSNRLLSMLQTLSSHRKQRTLDKQTRVLLYDAIGVCLSRTGDYQNAIIALKKAQAYSHEIKYDWGIKQSYLNLGAAWHDSGNVKKAERCYRNALALAKRDDDVTLLRMCLNNLAFLLIDSDPASANVFIGRLHHLAKKEKDLRGMFDSLMLRGNAAVHHHNLRRALTLFKKAETLARIVQLYYGRSIALYNIATVYSDLGGKNLSKCFKYYEQSRSIAKSEGYDNVMRMTINGEASASLILAQVHCRHKRYNRAIKVITKILDWNLEPTHEFQSLLFRMQIHFLKGNEKQAAKDFNKARQICRANKLTREIVDLHMILGDYLWSRDARHKYKSIQAYLGGFILALDIDAMSFFKVGDHIMWQLLSLNSVDRANRTLYLWRKIQVWVKRESPRITSRHIIYWPFRVALRFAEILEHQQKPTNKQINEIISQEFKI